MFQWILHQLGLKGECFGTQEIPSPLEMMEGGGQPHMRCPCCRAQFELPTGGTAQLRTCGSEYYDNVSISGKII